MTDTYNTSGQNGTSENISIRDNKPLLAVIGLIALIFLVAIGIGLYSLISNLTKQDEDKSNEDETEIVVDDSTVDEETSFDDESTDFAGEDDIISDDESNPLIPEETDSVDETIEPEEVIENEPEINTEEPVIEETTTEEESVETAEDELATESEGNVSANGAVSTMRNLATLTQNAINKSTANQARINQSGVWYATDYVYGDVIAGVHTVQLGDTLWELAEGVYGSGYSFTKILDANKESIGYLPDGSQALILPGQTLILPN